jgi:hypothetical protein
MRVCSSAPAAVKKKALLPWRPVAFQRTFGARVT